MQTQILFLLALYVYLESFIDIFYRAFVFLRSHFGSHFRFKSPELHPVDEFAQVFSHPMFAMRSLLVSTLISGVHSHGWMTQPLSRAEIGCFGYAGNSFWCLTHQSTGPHVCDGLPCGDCDLPNYPAGSGGGNCTAASYPGTATPKEPYCNPNQMPNTSFLEIPGAVQSSYSAGETIEVAWVVDANHAGVYQYRLCLDGSDTEECFKKTQLRFADGALWHNIPNPGFTPDRYYTENGWRSPMKVDRVVIPSDVQCDRCTLSWRWDAYYESTVFTSCADVAISSSSAVATVHRHSQKTGAFLK